MNSETYISSEDSRFLRESLRDYSGDTCLEIGVGNGGLLIELRERFNLVVGTDLTLPSMEDWKGAGVNLVLADRALCMRSSTFDLVAFNPPYLRTEITDAAVDGGENLGIPVGFLEEAIRVAKRTGTIVFLLNDEADIGAFKTLCAASGLELEKLATRRAFFEELSVYAARSQDPNRTESTQTST